MTIIPSSSSLTPPIAAVASSTVSSSSSASSSSNSNDTYRMVALDLDGTLLHSNHQMSDATREYLVELDRRGFTVMIATGRSATTLYEQVQRLNLPHPLPVVCSNGSRGLLCSVEDDDSSGIVGAVASKELFSTPVPASVARQTIQLARDLGYVSQYYVGENIYADPRLPHHFELTELYQKLTGSATIYVEDDFEEAMKLGPPSKQLVLCPLAEQDDMIAAFQKALLPVLGGDNDKDKTATIIRGSMGWFLEVLHPDVCKGYGLTKMCSHLDIELADVIAFGDGDNDYEFIQMAGKGIVMKNGADIVKEVGDEVIDYTNDEDGVLKTLKRMEAEGKLVFTKP